MSSASTSESSPDIIQQAHDRWLETRAPAALDALVLEAIAYHRPVGTKPVDMHALPDGTSLVADLGYDSLALAEIVFLMEDLCKVSISNEELKTIVTIGDLRAYVRSRIKG